MKISSLNRDYVLPGNFQPDPTKEGARDVVISARNSVNRQLLKKVIDDLLKKNATALRQVSNIIDTRISKNNVLGLVSSEFPNTIVIDVNRVRDAVNGVNVEGALESEILRVITHEQGHVMDFDPRTGRFPGGEHAAHRAEISFL